MATHTYWRLLFQEVQSGTVGDIRIQELYMAATSGGPDLTTGGTASASHVFSTFVAANAFDNNTSTYWRANVSTPLNRWIKYQFTVPVEIREIILRASATPADTPTVFTVQFSDDNVNWFDEWAVNTPRTWTSGLQRTFLYTTQNDELTTAARFQIVHDGLEDVHTSQARIQIVRSISIANEPAIVTQAQLTVAESYKLPTFTTASHLEVVESYKLPTFTTQSRLQIVRGLIPRGPSIGVSYTKSRSLAEEEP